MADDIHSEIESLRSELNRIAKELDSIASGIRGDFRNIGNDKCANRLEQLAEAYRGIRSRLGRIDM